MGANAQTTVPTFTAGEVLTAAQQNNSARTGVPVFATTGTRDAGFGGTGEKTLAEGQLCYVEGTGLQSYNGTSWVTWGTAPSSGALVLVKSQVVGTTVSSVEVTGAFSATYDNYLITYNSGTATNTTYLSVQLGATTTGYYSINYSSDYVNSPFTAGGVGRSNVSAFDRSIRLTSTKVSNAYFTLQSPNLAAPTIINSNWQEFSGGSAAFSTGSLDNTTAYTAFTLIPAAGTISGGTIRVYGYANS